MVSLKYTGTHVYWIEGGRVKKSYDATSGMDQTKIKGKVVRWNYQQPKFQCAVDKGPIPEGTYAMRLRFDKDLVATVKDPATCRLTPGRAIQQIPEADPKTGTGECGPYWRNWGSNRVRIDAYDVKARTACGGRRGGFYLHDSSKGFTHGCVEISHQFFVDLYNYVNRTPKQKTVLVDVDYSGTRSTRGATMKP